MADQRDDAGQVLSPTHSIWLTAAGIVLATAATLEELIRHDTRRPSDVDSRAHDGARCGSCARHREHSLELVPGTPQEPVRPRDAQPDHRCRSYRRSFDLWLDDRGWSVCAVIVGGSTGMAAFSRSLDAVSVGTYLGSPPRFFRSSKTCLSRAQSGSVSIYPG